MPMIKVLLLTNRDSDNVGDQIIEANVLSLLKAVMKNLDVPAGGFSINSRAAGIISRKYMQTKDPVLLEDARKTISSADVVVFGGAPLFNYAYQNFYLRTIKTLELAQEYGVPVLFSSIGVEPFDESNPKCLSLKAALNQPCVRQITTRDDLASVQKYVAGTDIDVARVADPAVFSDIVLPAADAPSVLPDAKKRIGLVVTRAGIFRDNKIDFPEAEQRRFWREVISLLRERGYDYKLFTTGHFSDEVFLDSFVKADGIPQANAAITVNSPEELAAQLRVCAGVIAFRLHASITSYAFEIPSVGLSWNFKVPYFYESVGYGARALPPEQWNATAVVDAIERAMADGVQRDVPFLMSVYETLFAGFKGIFAADSAAQPYSFEQLKSALPAHPKTTQAKYKALVTRKFRRTYENYQKLAATARVDPARTASPAPTAPGFFARLRRSVTTLLKG